MSLVHFCPATEDNGGFPACMRAVNILICLPWRKRHVVIVLQVAKKECLPSDEDLSKEVVNVLSGVDVLEFNIKMLMKHLSKLFLCTLHHV